MQRILCSLAIASLAAVAAAQSPLTTTLVSNNAGGVGGGIYFDLTVNFPITVISLDVTLNTALGTLGSIDILTCPVTRVGNQTNPGAWTLLASGACTSAGPSFPTGGILSSVAIPPTPLPVGTYGVALRGVGHAFAYTNGTGANQIVSTTEVTLNAGEASNAAFTAPLFTPRVVGWSIGYSFGGGGTVLATNTTLGAGCGQTNGSLYESFATSGAFDLSNTSMTMIPAGGGYVVLNTGAFLPVGSTSAPVVLPLTDDSQVNMPLTAMGSFPHATGSTTSLQICSNGFVSVAAGNGTAFTPAVPATLNAPATSWRDWHDFNPAIAGSGTIKFEESASVTVVTWDGVWDFGGASAASANTMQMQFYSSGIVTISWGTMSLLGNPHLVSYSKGGASNDPGNTDLSVALPSAISLPAENGNLTLAGTNRPIQMAGPNNWNLTVSNVPAAGLGLDIFGLADPGILNLQLFGLGQLNCQLHATLDIVAGPWFAAGVNHNFSFTIPGGVPSLVNFHLFVTSAVLDPSLNLALTTTTNGIDGKIGDF